MRGAAFAVCVLSACAFAAHSLDRTLAAGPQKKKDAKPAAVSTAASAPPSKPAPVEVREVDEAELAQLVRGEGAARTGPLLVNFWATWCDPCREEFPDLVKIDDEFRPRGLEFVTVSLDDTSELNNAVPRFIEKMGAARIPAYLLNATEPEAAIAAVDREWRGELPATFLFDRAGRLVYRHTGRVKPKELRAAVEQALSAAKPATTATKATQ